VDSTDTVFSKSCAEIYGGVGDGACVARGVDTLDILCPSPRSDGYSQAVLPRKQEAHEGRVSEHCISKPTNGQTPNTEGLQGYV